MAGPTKGGGAVVRGVKAATASAPKKVPAEPGNGPKQGQRARGVKSATTSAVLGPTSYASSNVTRMFRAYEALSYWLPWEILDYIELLATYNPDYSQAVDNIITLANSGHELYASAGSELASRRLKEYLNVLAANIQGQHGGMDGLIDKLLHQAATYGAMCGEWVIDDEMTTVVDFADINPKTIRYFWEEDEKKFCPYQKLSAGQAQRAKDEGKIVVNGSYVKLNEMTFHYYAFNAAPNSPYGTPPFIGALENIAIQRDMVSNMSQIVKKIGLLGLIDLVVEQLPMLPGETDEQYAGRASAYLDSYVTAAEDMVRDGGLVHFDDVEVKSTNIAGNAAGATAIFKQNEELVFSGLKSMPSVQGRSYSTTETYAGVAYDIIIRNTKKYQRACKRMIENGYYLAASLAGLKPEQISITFNQNKTLNRLQDAQSEAMEIKNAAMLWVAGVYDQQDFAQALGHFNIKKNEDTVPPELIGAANANTGTTNGGGGGSADGGGKPNNQNNN